MGTIQKQSMHSTAITFLGIGVGIISRFLMPFFLTKGQIGTLALLDSISAMISIIFCLGFPQITLRVFPSFRNEENNHSGYLNFGLIVSVVGVLLGWFAYYVLQDQLVGNTEETTMIQTYAYLIYPLIFFSIFFRNIDMFFRMLYKSVIGVFLEGLLLKIITLIGILLYVFNFVDFEKLVYIYVIAFSLPGAVYIFLALKESNIRVAPSKKLFTKEKRKQMYGYGAFGILASASGIIILTIDQLMLNHFLGTEQVGLYSIMFFAGILVSTPARGIKRIASTVIAESWKTKDLNNIGDIYTKSAVTLLITGQFLFIIGWACIDQVITFLPQYEEGIYVFFFIGLAQLIDMMTGVNHEIILTSTKYQYNTYFNVFLAILSIITNYFFINLYGLVGAAIASALSIFITNTLKWYFLKKTFNLQPFNKSFLISLIFGIALFMLVSFIKIDISPIRAILVYSIGITTIYWFIVYKLKLSDDISFLVTKVLKRLKFYK